VTPEALVRLVDALEDQTDTYVTLDQVESAAGADVSWAVAEHILLVDYRTRIDGSPATLCRLNRRHPMVERLCGGW
jgi:hypothetical protein